MGCRRWRPGPSLSLARLFKCDCWLGSPGWCDPNTGVGTRQLRLNLTARFNVTMRANFMRMNSDSSNSCQTGRTCRFVRDVCVQHAVEINAVATSNSHKLPQKNTTVVPMPSVVQLLADVVFSSSSQGNGD